MSTRDLVGYGRARPRCTWSNGARLAVSVVVNYEEGSERSLREGDGAQETGTEWGDYAFPGGVPNLAMETMYDYGARVGVWRVFDTLADLGVPCTVFACAVAFERNPDVAQYVRTTPHEVCSHGHRWEEVFTLTEEEELDHIRRAVASFESTLGRRPVGWYCRYGPSERTRELLTRHGGFVYDSDSYADDTPYYVEVAGEQRLVVPYTPDNNDFRFWQSNGPATAEQFVDYLKDAFDVLYAEGGSGARMMSLGLHPRMIGRPGRIRALRSFIEYASAHEGVWFATRQDIAEDWLRIAPPPAGVA